MFGLTPFPLRRGGRVGLRVHADGLAALDQLDDVGLDGLGGFFEDAAEVLGQQDMQGLLFHHERSKGVRRENDVWITGLRQGTGFGVG
jgi:hypothetical protein